MSPVVPDRETSEAFSIAPNSSSNIKLQVDAGFWVGAALKRAVAAIMFAAILAGGVAAETFEDGWAAYSGENYIEAEKMWRLQAERGRDDAQLGLGLLYSTGRGVQKDFIEAAKWFRLAADQGNAEAQFAIGLMIMSGQGMLQDYTEAVKWYRLSAEQGYASAQGHLGMMYGTGRGVSKDLVVSYMWFNVSSAQGDTTAKQGMDVVLSEMTHDQIAQGQRLSRECLASNYKNCR